MATILPGAEPFLLPGNREEGILLLHGLTGSPSEMRLLGEYLHKLGYTVLAPRLAGHGTIVSELKKTDWPLWYNAALDGYHLLAGLCKQISVIGLSMGALLALKLCSELPLKKAVSISAPVHITDKRLKFLPIYKFFRDYAPKKRHTVSDLDPAYSVHYNAMPLNSVTALLKLITHIKKLLPAVTLPLLTIQSRNDHTVKPTSGQFIYNHAGSQQKELIWLQKSGHIVTLGSERTEVFASIKLFLAKK